MKTIQIPTNSNPFTVVINNHEYVYKAGETLEVPDEVAAAIEDALELAPKPGRSLSRFAQFVAGSITEVKSEDLDGITNISRCAFYNYDSLISIVVPDSVTSIGNEAFSDCSKLKSATFGENSQLTSIEGYAFYNCVLLTDITIPSSVTSIGNAAFSKCMGLKKVTMRAVTPPTIKTDSFSNVPTTCVFEVPSVALEAYKSAEYWSAFANQIVAIEE